MKTIYFDMDGTIADLYAKDNWLDLLKKEIAKPYREAKSLVNMRELSKELNRLKKNGYKIGIISWLSKNSSDEYKNLVEKTKRNWLKTHLGSVTFDEIHIVDYGTPKHQFAKSNDILFDDNEKVRKDWIGKTYTEKNILNVLREI